MEHFTDTLLDDLLDGRPFRFYPQVASTNDVARDWQMANPLLPSGTIVLAEEQTAGRGRGTRTWHSPAHQSLIFSLILRPTFNADELHRITMMAGVAVAETLVHYLPPDSQNQVSLKWPNDVLIDGRKVCGILAEAVWFGNDLDAVVLGIGVNVDIDFTHTELAGLATSVNHHMPHRVERSALLKTLLTRLDYWEFNVDGRLLVDTWREWLGTLGQTICFETIHAGVIEGVAKDVDATGALILEDATGKKHRVLVGDVLRRVNSD